MKRVTPERLVIDPVECAPNGDDEEAKENAKLVARIPAKYGFRLEDRSAVVVCSHCRAAMDAASQPRFVCSGCEDGFALCPSCYHRDDASLRHRHGSLGELFHEETQQRWAIKSRLARLAQSGRASCGSFATECLRAYSPRVFLGRRRTEGGEDSDGPSWDWMTYSDVFRESSLLAGGLSAVLGISPGSGEAVAVLCDNRPEWAIVDFACMFLPCVSVPVPLGCSSEGIAASLAESGAAAVFVSERRAGLLLSALAMVRSVAYSDKPLHLVVIPDGFGDGGNNSTETLSAVTSSAPAWCRVHTWKELLSSGGQAAAAPELTCDRRKATATVMFTSGTTGLPKKVVFTESDWVEQMVHVVTLKLVALYGYLPLSHVAGRVDLYTALCNGGMIAFPADVASSNGAPSAALFDDLRVLRPTAFGPVPRVCTAIREEYDRIVKAHVESGLGKEEAKKLARKGLRGVLGGRLCSIKITSAPTTAKMRGFLRKVLKIACTEGYGTTEAGSIALNGRLTSPVMLESVSDLGYSVNGDPPRGQVHVPKELLRCSQVPPKNAGGEETTWWATGDIGEWSGGKLTIIDRIGNCVKLSNGLFVALGHLERVFEQSPLIRQVFAYADAFKPSVVLVVLPNDERVDRSAVEHSVYELAKGNSLAPHEIPCGLHICRGDDARAGWTFERGLCTDTGKPIRRAIVAKYRREIDAVYTAAALARAATGKQPIAQPDVWALSFAQLGGDSIAALRVAAELRSQHVHVPSLDRLVAVPISSVASCCSSRQSLGGCGEDDEVALQEELPWFADAFARLLSREETAHSRHPDGEVKSVFMTGATGFVGGELLRGILAAYPAATVHCLCRNSGRLPTDNLRVVPVIGDLALPLFGMTQAEFDSTLTRVSPDIVVHAAASVNHVWAYDDLRATNVLSLADVLSFCFTATGRWGAPLHVVSSSAVYHDRHLRGAESGYSTSKWMEESLALEAHRMAAEHGVPNWQVCIHRPALVGPHSVTGDANAKDWLTRLLHAVMAFGVVPAEVVPGQRTALNMVSVDYCSEVIVALMKTNLGGARPTIVDIGGINSGLEAFLSAAASLLGVEKVPYMEWFAAVKRMAVERNHPVIPFIDSWSHALPGIPLKDALFAERRAQERRARSGTISSNAVVPFVPLTVEAITAMLTKLQGIVI